MGTFELIGPKPDIWSDSYGLILVQILDVSKEVGDNGYNIYICFRIIQYGKLIIADNKAVVMVHFITLNSDTNVVNHHRYFVVS